MFPIKNICTVFYDKNSRQIQHFSLPKPIIYYLIKNIDSIQSYQNLIQTCKYFYAINPSQPVPCLYFKAYETKEWLTCSRESSSHLCETNKLKNNSNSPKLWLTNSFRLYASHSTSQRFIAEIIPKIYRCHVTRLILSTQQLEFDEFLFLTPKVKHFHFHYVFVYYNNNNNQSPVEFEKIVEKLPKLEIFKYKFFKNDPSISLKTAKKLIKINHFKNLKELYIYNIPSKFDFNSFYSFISKNNKIKCDLTFRQPIFENYKNSIEAYKNGIQYFGNNNVEDID